MVVQLSISDINYDFNGFGIHAEYGKGFTSLRNSGFPVQYIALVRFVKHDDRWNGVLVDLAACGNNLGSGCDLCITQWIERMRGRSRRFRGREYANHAS